MPKSIMVGIPCYQGVAGETLDDYMRFAFNLGRRYQEFDFFLAVKTKSEQFRARNAIVEGALQLNCEYVLMMDDDHIIDWEGTQAPNNRYNFLKRLVGHMEDDPKLGLVGCLYYMRMGDCRPVLMKANEQGGFNWLRDDEITGGLQEVDVQGGGCMLIRTSALLQVDSLPWFQPELEMGTDIQICTKLKKAGWKVACDTSIEIGHVCNSREIITSKNRILKSSENIGRQPMNTGLTKKWAVESALNVYRLDAEEYTGCSFEEMTSKAATYNTVNLPRVSGYSDLKEYYRSLGVEQICRQVWFHFTEAPIQWMQIVFDVVDTTKEGKGLDYGCGSAPVGMELAKRGHHIDFVDIDGSPAYEFTKWRVAKHKVKAGFELSSGYHYALFMDSIEHIPMDELKGILADVVDRIEPQGAIITNYFSNEDYENPEHVNMDKPGVKDVLVGLGMYPLNPGVWIKQDFLKGV